MSWFRRALLLACVALLPTGCGFHPVYGDHGGKDESDLTPVLASIAVDSIRDRIGQEITNSLRDGLNPQALSVPANYRLEVALTEGVLNLMTRSNDSASRTNTIMGARWSLIRLADNKTILSGTSRATTGHDVLTSEYANLVSGKQDETNAIRELSDDIQQQIALYFRHPK
jgi:LPS-assembly lipoprotein